MLHLFLQEFRYTLRRHHNFFLLRIEATGLFVHESAADVRTCCVLWWHDHLDRLERMLIYLVHRAVRAEQHVLEKALGDGLVESV